MFFVESIASEGDNRAFNLDEVTCAALFFSMPWHKLYPKKSKTHKLRVSVVSKNNYSLNSHSV